MTYKRSITVLVAALSLGALAACSDNQNVNAATGALVGAAAGNQVGSGSGRTAATLLGAAAGAQVGAQAPTN
ncbi:MAG: glycine zipper 2TM domain-containing protein [Pseudomonadota bacterium]